MLNPFAAFLGIICAVIAVAVMIRALTINHLVQTCTRGLKAILDRLELHGWNPDRPPPHLSKGAKLWAALTRGLLRSL